MSEFLWAYVLQYIQSSPGRGSCLSSSVLLSQAKCKGSNVRFDMAILHQSPFYSHLSGFLVNGNVSQHISNE